MIAPFASICILAYKRPDKLKTCLDSLITTIDSPAEIIVNVDGESSRDEALNVAISYFMNKQISKLIISNGKNRGIGLSFQNCIGVSEGKYIFKVDADIVFKPKWLSTSIDILDNNPDVGAVSMFNYNHYDPDDIRFRNLYERPDCFIVSDLVSSIYGFRRIDLAKIFPINDDGNHKKLGQLMAITKTDLVETKFGYADSVYIYLDEDGKGHVTGKTETPLIF